MIWQPKCWWFFVCFWPPLEQCVTKIWTKQNPKLFPIPIFSIPNPIPIFSDTDTDTNTFVDTNTFFDTELFQNDNDVSDNCDHNFGTFYDFGVKNDQKVSHNMILMSKYRGQHGGKRVKKFGQGPPPPLFRQCPKEIVFFLWEVFH